MNSTSDPFNGANDCTCMSLALFSPGTYSPLREYSMYNPVYYEDGQALIWTNNWDDKPRKKFLRSINIRREYFYYPNNVECRGTVKRALLQGLADRSTFSSGQAIFSFVVTNDIEEIDSVYGRKTSELIIYGSPEEALIQYHRLLKVLTWLNSKVPIYLQRNKSWDIMGPQLLEYVKNVEIHFTTLELAFQNKSQKNEVKQESPII